MRIIAILTTYNEERFIANCLEHLFSHGVEVYLIDNCSTDQTVHIARRYSNQGLIGIETLLRQNMFSLKRLLENKEQLAATLEADWFMHVDADEIHLPPRSNCTLAQAFSEVDAQGYNAVNFMEFTFIPTQETPNHDHSDYRRSMRWYYPFLPFYPHLLNAWKRQSNAVELAWSGGHQVRFPGMRIYPETFRMLHYHFLSIPHAIQKYVEKVYDPAEVQVGWHGWRAKLKPEMIKLPPQSQLRTYVSDDLLDSSNPRKELFLAEIWASRERKV